MLHLYQALQLHLQSPLEKIADVYIYAYSGAALTGGFSTSWAVADVIIFKNGTFLPVGGWNRIKLNNRDGTIADMNTTSLICIDRNVTAGTYTYDLRGNRYSGNQGVSVGGGLYSTSKLCRNDN